MRVLLISTYELGHQPLHVASPAAALRQAGHEVACLDLSVQPWDDATVAWAEAVALSVPMHTAMRLAIAAAERIRTERPELPICLYGLYAPVGRDRTVGRCADHVVAGEYEPGLLAWVDGLAGRAPSPAGPVVVHLGRGRASFVAPARDLLPPLDSYAHYVDGDGHRVAGYTETTHGCAYRCRHCPLPTVYDGAFRVVDADVVLADIDQLVSAGARHITFGDPDFLNGPTHVRRIVEGMHQRHPQLTFDCTVKVEHVLAHAEMWEPFAAAGCRFVVSAVELLNDELLALLDKGHTAQQAAEAMRLLRAAGIEPRPTFLPFTPWTRPRDLADILDFVVGHDLIGNVDPIQYAIRLLLPDGSLLLDRPELAPHLGTYDAERLSWTWTAADPRVDALHAELAALVERDTAAGRPAGATFLEVYASVQRLGGAREVPQLATGSIEGRPRLTEPWFC